MTAKPVPANVDSTQGAHFRTLVGSGTTVVIWAVLSAILFTLGAAKQWPAVMFLGPLALALVVAAYCWYLADKHAENEFFGRFAAAHGLNHWAEYSIPSFTPLLAGGDRRGCVHWMESKGRALGWYTYEIRHENGDKPDTWEPHHFTVAAVDVGEHGMGRFQGIYLRRRRGIFDRLDTESNWLKNKRLETVELESTAFCETYELYRDRDQDELVMRQLFAPSFVIWLSEHPLKPGFELRAGQLVVFIPGRCGEAGKLQFLMMAATDISKRIQAELSEAAQAGSL